MRRPARRASSCLLLLVLVASGCHTKSSPVTQQGSVMLQGIARNAKGGAVLVTDEEEIFYLAGLESWPEGVEGRRVEVSGEVSEEQYLPEAYQDEHGAWSQGAFGKQQVIRNPHWALTE